MQISTYLLANNADIRQNRSREIPSFNPFFHITPLAVPEGNYPPQLSWQYIQHVVKKAKAKNEDHIILCRHADFLDSFSDVGLLAKIIEEAKDFNTKLLVSNIVSEEATLVPVSQNLLWTDSIIGFGFVVVYKSCFDLILNENCNGYSSIETCIEDLTSNKLLIYHTENSVASRPEHEKMQIRIKRLIAISNQLKKEDFKVPAND